MNFENCGVYMRACGVVVILIAAAGCGPTSQRAAQNQIGDANEASPDTSNASTTETAAPEAPRSEWRYQSRNDAMTDRPTHTACVWSSNEAQLDFPYGSTRAELCLRDSPQYGEDAYVALEGDGQILCHSFQDCTVRVRFDNEEMRNYSAVGPSDNSTNVVFIRGRDRLERGLGSADRTAIQIEFYQAGQQALIFPTARFDWEANRAAEPTRRSR